MRAMEQQGDGGGHHARCCIPPTTTARAKVPAAVAAVFPGVGLGAGHRLRGTCAQFGTLDNLPEQSRHPSQRHPPRRWRSPKLMRIHAGRVRLTAGRQAMGSSSRRTVAYTNHTVMAEALECWPEDLFRPPACRASIRSSARSTAASAQDMDGKDRRQSAKVGRMAIISYGAGQDGEPWRRGRPFGQRRVPAAQRNIEGDACSTTSYTVMPDKFKQRHERHRAPPLAVPVESRTCARLLARADRRRLYAGCVRAEKSRGRLPDDRDSAGPRLAADQTAEQGRRLPTYLEQRRRV